MFDIFLDKLKSLFASRLLPITLVYLILFTVLVNRMFQLQIVEGETHSKEQNLKETKERVVQSTRGSIYDSKGVLLAYNELSYSIMLEDSGLLTSNAAKNKMLHKLIQIIEENGDSLDSDFPIKYENGMFYFSIEGNALTRFKKTAYAYVLEDGKLTEEQKNSSAKDVYMYLCYGQAKISKMFDISDEYSIPDALKIMALRYDLFSNYPKYVQVTVASKVSEKTVAAVLENQAEMPGIEVKQQTSRVYNDSEYFAHILGYTGLASQDDLEVLNAEKETYTAADYIGKSGVEKEYESYLAGKKGIELVTMNSANKIIETKVTVDPIAGNDLYLSIDSELQKTIYQLAERKLASIMLSKIVPNLDYGTKGESANDILTPIYEVYFALINNNIIDIEHFEEKDATDLEKQVLAKYETSLSDVMNKLNTLLTYGNETLKKNAPSGMDQFLEYCYTLLANKKIILTSNIPSNDDMFIKYKSDKISLSRFLQYAISEKYIDLDKLDIGDNYYSSEEIYNIMIDYLKNELVDDSEFNKIIYRNLVFSYKLSGLEISLLLFDQGVLEYNEDEVNALRNGRISAYSFMLKKIEALEITPAMLALEPYSCSVVVTDVNTGALKAMVSYPSYDNNMLANKVDAEYYAELLADNSKPLLNRPTQQRTAPGSTFKMLSAVTALEEGVIGITDKITDLGIFERIKPSPKCHKYPSSHGSINVSEAIKFSCNYFFYECGWRLSLDSSKKYLDQLGISKLEKYARMFGLGDKSGVEGSETLPKISDEHAVPSAIGQGTNSYAPVQLSKYVSTIANGGTCYNLSLLNSVVDKDGKVIFKKEPDVFNDLTTSIKSSTWNAVQKGMYMVANESGGSVYSLFHNLGVTVSAKTGTAQVSKSNPSHALFVSYAPTEDPEISVTVVIPNGHTSGNAAALGRDIYKYYFGLATSEELLNGDVPENSSSVRIQD